MLIRLLTTEQQSALVTRLIAGDATAFDEAYESYHKRVYGFILRMVRRREVAEDMLQETWLRLATNASRLRSDTQLGPWLFTVARNLCRSYHRWRILDSERMSEFTLARYRKDESSPFDAIAANQMEQRLETALASLTPRYREVVLLVIIERMAPSDAAQVLGLAQATLRQRLSRARVMIAKSLGDMLDKPDAQKKGHIT